MEKKIENIYELIDGVKHRAAFDVPRRDYYSSNCMWDMESNFRTEIEEEVSFCVEVVLAQTKKRIFAKYFAITCNGRVEQEKWFNQDTGESIDVHADDVWEYTKESLEHKEG